MGDLDKRVINAQQNSDERESIINEYIPFIKSTVNSFLTEKVRYLYDDAVSTGFIAFDEAITKYNMDKGPFLTFAKFVIRNRTYDFLASNNKYIKNNYISLNDDEKDEVTNVIDKKAKEVYDRDNEVLLRQNEIEEYKEELKKYNIDMKMLTENSPKQKRTREMYKKIALHIINNEECMDYLKRNQRLPIKNIIKNMKVPRKKIERGRIYIIGIVILLKGDYPMLKEYI